MTAYQARASHLAVKISDFFFSTFCLHQYRSHINVTIEDCEHLRVAIPENETTLLGVVVSCSLSRLPMPRTTRKQKFSSSLPSPIQWIT
jgi:hypothetical protein